MSSSNQDSASAEQTVGNGAETPVPPPPETNIKPPTQTETQPDPVIASAQPPVLADSKISPEKSQEETKEESPVKSIPPESSSSPRDHTPAESVPPQTNTQSPPLRSEVGSVSNPKFLERSSSQLSQSEQQQQQNPVQPNASASQQITTPQQQQQHPPAQQVPPESQTQPAAALETAPLAVVVTTTMQQPVYTTTAAVPIAQPQYATTPIVKMQGTTDHIVKKKKGRFKLLEQQTTAQPTPAGASTTTTNNSASTTQPGGSETMPPPVPIPRVLSQSNVVNGNHNDPSSSSSTVTANNMSNTAAQQTTFDGTSAPMVKKKGRFVVTNVKDPGSMGVQAQQAQQQAVTGLPLQQAVATSPMAPSSQSGNSATDQGQLSTSGSAPAAYQHATMMSVVTPPGHVMQQAQPIMYAPTPQQGQSYPQMATYTLQQPVLQPPLPTPATTAAAAATTIEGANVPANNNNKAKVQKERKSASVPRSNSVGMNGEHGLGKVFYFLEQMRLEVSEADRTIKNLQTESKFLKEKNKELEARAREADRKVVEERTLRECAEVRVKALRKKLRGLKGEHATGTEAEAMKEEEALSSICVAGHSPADSMDGKELVGLDISHAANPMHGGGEDSKSSLVVAPIMSSPGVPLKRETSTGTGVSNDSSKPTGSVSGKVATGNQGTNKTPPRGIAVAKTTAQKRTPTSPVIMIVPASSDSAARGGVLQRNSSTGSLSSMQSLPSSARPQAAVAPASNGALVNPGTADGTPRARASTFPTPMNSADPIQNIGHSQSNPPVNIATSHSASDFDPHRPTSQMYPGQGGLSNSNPVDSMQAMAETSGFMMNQHTMAVPVLSIPASVMEGAADLMGFEAQPMMLLALGSPHSQENRGTGDQNYQDLQQQSQGAGSFDDMQQQMLLVSQQQFVGMQQPHNNWIQPTSDPNKWTNPNVHQQHGQPAMMVSTQQQPGMMAANAQIQPDLLSSQPNTNAGTAPRSAGLEQNSDPFDELVSRRPSSNHAQQH